MYVTKLLIESAIGNNLTLHSFNRKFFDSLPNDKNNVFLTWDSNTKLFTIYKNKLPIGFAGCY